MLRPTLCLEDGIYVVLSMCTTDNYQDTPLHIR
jgi:hypothetical protein